MRLFKYFGPDRLSILQSRLIRFSQPSAFNDPFEFLPYIDAIDTPENITAQFQQTMNRDFSEEYDALDALTKSQITKEHFRTYMQSFFLAAENNSGGLFNQLALYAQGKINEVSSQHFGVLCLSERHDDLLMWAHYADCHKGFVIEFDSDSPFFHQRRSEKDDLRYLRPVVYSKERPAITLTDTDMSELFLTKSEHWEYEKEWRMVVGLADADKIIPDVGGDICLYEFPAEAVKAIFVGSKMQEDTFSALIRNVDGDSSLNNLKVFKGRVHPINYSLIFEMYER
ncbi:DUF2971 domain-containing protein [Pseudomonas rhodesiae]|uniref:DUF2971 domain-containing protein n=1 Tax=Pseudomonas rhodesiae TaxID=76760 RepID=UPI000F47CDC3|nr:DUF2971 domain-containing protein [Pseudomonas rhodesiae]ROM60417.1 hypothetical protein BK650_03075 [Pseudomonas rhodesiae]ROM68061.1 hypothetical protein BK651_02965 [Pseudomonas rhodesiae]